MAEYMIAVDDCDLADMAAGRFLRECPGSIEHVKDNAVAYILADERMVMMQVDPHLKWLSRALSATSVQVESRLLAQDARAAGGEVDYPWRD